MRLEIQRPGIIGLINIIGFILGVYWFGLWALIPLSLAGIRIHIVRVWDD